MLVPRPYTPADLEFRGAPKVLEDAGVAETYDLKPPAVTQRPEGASVALAAAYAVGKSRGLSTEQLEALMRDEMKRAVGEVADHLVVRARAGMQLSATRGVAPLAFGLFTQMGGLLPAHSLDGSPVQEASLVSCAVRSVAIDDETSAEDVLRFRSRNANQLGRFRASMVDLAGSMQGAYPLPE